MITKEIAGLKTAMSSLRTQLYTDTLTSIHNRKWLVENLLHDGEFITDGTLIFIDLDKFKPINDIHGRVIGDKVLQYLASFLKSMLKDMDVIRYEGGEFLLIAKNEQMEECYMKTKRLQENLLSKKLKAANGELLYLSFPFGLTRFEVDSNFRDTLEIADSLMYENKKSKAT